jgi:isochorismate synthase
VTSVTRATAGARAGTPLDRATPVAARLRLPPGPAIDPFALAGDTGTVLADGERTLVGLGRALSLELPGGLDDGRAVAAAGAALAAIPCDDALAAGSAGHGVVAFGALPFDRGAAALLEVPELTYGREADGTEWVTVVADDVAGLPDPDDPDRPAAMRHRLADRAAAHAAPVAGTGRPVVRPRTDDREFRQAVARAVDAVHHGEVDKVVLARTVDVGLGGAVDVPGLLARWAGLEPACTMFAVTTPDGRFVGASPELLVERVGDRVTSRPLAGTTDRDHDATSTLPPSLTDSAKDAEEHRLVVRAILDDLDPVCSRLDVPERPELVHLRSITHLGTTVTGILRPVGGSVPTALELVARLHPTPAVGGVPRDAARQLIARLEPGPRGSYAGPVGYLDGAGDGRWMVGIRAVTVRGSGVVMTAGVGIVGDSDPATELEETRLKFRAVYDALAPGVEFDTGVPTG